MTTARHRGPSHPCASLLLVAARCAPGMATLYLADPAIRLTTAERRRLRRPTDGHTPTAVATTPTQLARVLWAVTARMSARYLAALLTILTVWLTRRMCPPLARWLLSAAPRHPVLLVVSKQLLTRWPRPLAGLLGWPVATLAGNGPTVGIRLLLMAPSGGPDDPVELGRAGRRLQEVDLPAPHQGALAQR